MNNGRVYVYAADVAGLRDPALFARGFQLVSPQRQEKVNHFLFEKDRQLSLGAGLLLRYCLRLHGVRFPEIAVGTQGKLYLKNSRLQFNLSHSGERVMCAVSDREVGCDVEKITEIEPDAAELCFSPEEYRWAASGGSPEEQRERFFRIWTLKESFAKMTGLGMDLVAGCGSYTLLPQGLLDTDLRSQSLFTIEIRPESGVWKLVSGESYENDVCFMREYDRSDGYRYAVCGLEEDIAEELFFVDLRSELF